MEFCGVFYETGYLRAVYDRIRKLFFVFLMAAVLTVGMMGQGMEKKPYRMLRSLRRFCQMIRRSAENCQTFR